MGVAIHIIFAIVSLLITGFTAFSPTRSRIITSVVTIGLTLGSGVLLAVFDHTKLAHVCASGLIYLTIESLAVVYATKRMAAKTQTASGRAHE